MRILIAGCGSVGRRHLRNLQGLGENDIVLYRSGYGTMPADELAQFPAESDLERALGHKPDAVIVSNPTALHLKVAIAAVEAGCHLLLEKPVSHTMAGVDRLLASVEKTGVRVCVGFQYRFHPGLQQIRQWLVEGAIGRAVAARASYGDHLPDWHPWEDYRQSYSAREDLGGGAILTLCHPLDYLRWMLGDVESVWASAANLGGMGIDVDDTAEIVLRFASGVLGAVHLDLVQRPPSHSLEVIGTGGTLRWDQADGTARIYRADVGSWEDYRPPSAFERNDMFLAEMHNFLQVCQGEAQPVCSLADGIAALRLSLAAQISAWADGSVSPAGLHPGQH